MEIPSSLESRLREIARTQGRDVQSVVQDVLRKFVESTPVATNGSHSSNGNGRIVCNTTDSSKLAAQDVADGIDDASFSKPSEQNPLRGTVRKYTDPYEPACPPEDWEAMQ